MKLIENWCLEFGYWNFYCIGYWNLVLGIYYCVLQKNIQMIVHIN